MKQKGFTLVELMVVMAVIAILAATALVAFTGVQKGARDTSRKTYTSQYRTALENFYSNNQAYPAAVTGNTCAALELGTGQSPATPLVPAYLSTALPTPSNAMTCSYTPSAGGGTNQAYILVYTLETGGSWVTCSSATQGGKACKLAATGPTDCTGCP